MSRAHEKHPEIVIWNGCPPIEDLLVDVSQGELERRVRIAVRRAAKAGHQSYIGSTSCPLWRWEGGRFWRSDTGAPDYMPGHHQKYGELLVLGCWPDQETKRLEPHAIKAARLVAEELGDDGVVDNKADDARGFATMDKHYAFIYVCRSVHQRKITIRQLPNKQHIKHVLGPFWFFLGIMPRAYRVSWLCLCA
eukprot:774346-Pyramimonas_sp.AAC.1